MARDGQKLMSAKLILYTELLKIDPDEASQVEVELVIALSRDPDIKRLTHQGGH